MSNCTIDFWENKADDDGSHDGGHRQFTGPTEISDLSKYYWDGYSDNIFHELDDCISSLKTGSQAWVQLWSQHNYSGTRQDFGPNTTVGDLSSYGMDNTIVSFKLFSSEPVDTAQVVQNFIDLYPDATIVGKAAGDALEFYAQDSHYRIYLPEVTQDSDVVSFAMNTDHDDSLGWDDHADIAFKADDSGLINGSMSVSYDMSKGAYQVPDWAVTLIDDGIQEGADYLMEEMDGAEIVLTDGLGAVLVIPTDILIEGAAKVLTALCDHMNDIISYVFGLMDDGGTMYYQCVNGHAIARLYNAYLKERYDDAPHMGFDQTTFLSALDGGDSWDTDKNTPHTDFAYSDDPDDVFRAYEPDVTAIYGGAGLITSCKIDAVNDNAKDDHLTLFVTFDPSGKPFSVQGGIDIYGIVDDDDDASDYKAPNSGVITYNDQGQLIQLLNSVVTVLSDNSIEDAYQRLMQDALDDVISEYGWNASSSLQGIVRASGGVLSAMDKAVTGA